MFIYKDYSFLKGRRFPVLPGAVLSGLVIFVVVLGCYDLKKSDFLNAVGDTTSLSWVVYVSGSGWDLPHGIDVFPGGDVVVVGQIGEGTADFDPSQDGDQDVTQTDGRYDIFLARYSSAGTLQWVKRAGGLGEDRAYDVAVNQDSSILVTGNIQIEAIFGQGEEDPVQVGGPGGGIPTFSASFGADGLLEWVKVPDSENTFHQGNAVDVAPIITEDLIHFSGHFSGDIVFGAGEDVEAALSAYSENDNMFLAAYRKDGDLAWAKQSLGGNAAGNGLVTLVGESVVVVGDFEENSVFGNEEPLNSAGNKDVFIVRYDTEGEVIWAKRAGGALADSGSSIAETEDGSLLVCGTFSDSAIFGVGESKETTLTSAGETDVFFAKYAVNDGSLIWAKRMGGPGTELLEDIAMLSDGSFILVGGFEGTVTLIESDDSSQSATTLESAGGFDAFFNMYDPNGNLLSKRREGGLNDDAATAVTIPADNSAIIAGYFDGTVTFGSGEKTQTELVSDGIDIFIMRLEI